MGPDEFTRFEMRQSQDDDGVLRLSLAGELDITGADQLEVRMRELKSPGTPLRLDLSSLEFIDSSGLNALITTATAAQSDGWQLEVDRRVQPQVGRVIELVGASPYLWPSGDPVVQDLGTD
jgi:anti-anti-sigma factor